MARSGANLILDQVVLNQRLREGWQSALAGLEVSYVGVHCSLVELERREVARGDRVIGQARGQFDRVHQGMRYDLEVDSTHDSPKDVALHVIEQLGLPRMQPKSPPKQSAERRQTP
jgi:chloramphenicol 3-O phosphotransferase